MISCIVTVVSTAKLPSVDEKLKVRSFDSSQCVLLLFGFAKTHFSGAAGGVKGYVYGTVSTAMVGIAAVSLRSLSMFVAHHLMSLSFRL